MIKWRVMDLTTRQFRDFATELEAKSYAKTIKSYKILKIEE